MEEKTEEVKNVEETKNIEEVELVTNANGLIIDQVCEALEENNIPYVKKEEGSGAYMTVITGFSFYNKTVVVSKEDYDRAKEIIGPILSTKEEEGIPEEDLPDELKYAEDDEENEESGGDSTIAHKMFWMLQAFVFISITAIILIIYAL